MTKFFEKIWGGVKIIAVHVSDGFKALFGAQAAKDFGKASLELLKSAAGQIVTGAVAALMNVEMSGPDKKAAAFSAAVPALEQQGIVLGKQIATRELNLLIELAVNSLKGAFMPVTAPNLPPAPEPAPQEAAAATVAGQ